MEMATPDCHVTILQCLLFWIIFGVLELNSPSQVVLTMGLEFTIANMTKILDCSVVRLKLPVLQHI